MGRRRPVLLVVPAAVAALVAVAITDRDAGESASAQAERCDPNARALTALRGGESARAGVVAQVDPRTLEPLSDGVPLTASPWAWALSLGGSRLAIAVGPRELQLIDLRRSRGLGFVKLSEDARLARAVAWPRRERVLVLRGSGSDGTSVAVVHPGSQRVVRRRLLSGQVLVAKAERTGIVALAAPGGHMGRARLIHVDGRGEVRTVPLRRISAGDVPPPRYPDRDQPPIQRTRQPGLAVNPEGGRAYIVGTAGRLVAEVELASRGIAYHELGRARSLAQRIRDLLEPPAEAKGSAGTELTARWLGNGLIAVSGFANEDDPETPVEPYGLRLIDTAEWTTRTADPQAAGFERTTNALVVWDHANRRLAVYELDGQLRFERELPQGIHGRRRAATRTRPARRASASSTCAAARRSAPAPGATRIRPSSSTRLLKRQAD